MEGNTRQQQTKKVKDARNKLLTGTGGIQIVNVPSKKTKLKVEDNFPSKDVIGDLPVFEKNLRNKDGSIYKDKSGKKVTMYGAFDTHLAAFKRNPKERLKVALGTDASPKLQSQGTALQGSKSSSNLKLTPSQIKQIQEAPKGQLPKFMQPKSNAEKAKGLVDKAKSNYNAKMSELKKMIKKN